jgi:GNAT superfamily N-acetyltransferase
VAPPAAAPEIRRLDAEAYAAAVPGLGALLLDAVEGGASVNFLAGLTLAEATGWWADRAAAVRDGSMVPFVAIDPDDAIVGSTVLFPAPQPNGPHRAEIGKVLVLRSARRRGIARALMATAEAHAFAIGRWLLSLDTHEGTEAESMYRDLGWTEFGRFPDHSLTTTGSLLAAVYFWKDLRPRGPGPR